MAISMADIEAIVAQFEKSDWRTIELVADGVELRLSKDGSAGVVCAAAPRATPTPAQGATHGAAEGAEQGAAPATDASSPPSGLVVTAPSLGTFYRAPRPGEPSFAEVGQVVAKGQELCLIEVMKLFTTVHAPSAGVVIAIHVIDGQLVEFGQPLVSIEPES